MANTFDTGDVLRHVKSGKLYIATGYNGSGAHRTGVYGWRNNRQFGPVRFIDSDKLERVGHDANFANTGWA